MKSIASILVVVACAAGTLCATIGNTTVEDDAWWGPKSGPKNKINSIQSFRPQFRNKMIKDLKYRLNNHRPFRAPLTDDFSYGFNSDHMAEWIHYWAEEYPFKQREKYINQYTHNMVTVQGLKIHFLHIRPKVPEGVELVPILMLHGFPSTILEYYEAIPHLTVVSDDRDFALELIIPSLPGFGYSDAASTAGLGVIEIAVVLRNLMKLLGYDKYYVQGGDWGSVAGTCIATLFPDEVLGFHTTVAISMVPQSFMAWYLGSSYSDLVVDSSLADRMYPISKILKYFTQEFGYYHINAAKPDTIGIVLSDTPSGLLAYWLQLVSMLTRAAYTYSKDGGLENQYTKTQLLDHMTIYWATNTINTAIRIYAESTNLRTFGLGVLETPTPVLTWTVHAPDEIIYQSPYLLKFKFPNLVNSTILDSGGHFLVMEMPEVFSEDVLKAVTAFRKVHKGNECAQSRFDL